MAQRISYAQYREDIILASLLDGVKKGFYVDIGANYETEDSVTKYFYNLGWSGINVEPVAKLFMVLKKKRKRDININAGVSDTGKSLVFYEHPTHGHSSFVNNSADSKSYKVKTYKLKDIFKDYKVEKIDFLKIDVEGFEHEVINSNDWSRYRPKVLCIEANHIDKDWRPILANADYRLFVFDGLNEYYIADECWDEITRGYAERAVMINASFIRKSDYDSLISTQRDSTKNLATVDMLNKENLKIRSQVEKLNHEYSELKNTSYIDKPLRRRLIIFAQSIINWVETKR